METYPTIGRASRMNIGRKTPPTAEPLAATPNANPRLFFHQCVITVALGPKVNPKPTFMKRIDMP
jgi:hypothetical protein